MIRVSIDGSLRAQIAAQANRLAQRVTEAVADTGLGLREDLRKQVTAAGLGDRLAKTWQFKVYPRSRVSLGAASLVYSKAPKIVRAFDEATVIRARNTAFLAIPTDAAPKTGIGGKRISPSNWPSHVYGRLRMVYRRGAPSLLVVDAQRERTGKQRGKFRLASARAIAAQRGLSTVVMFILVPQVKAPKLLDLAGAVRRAEQDFVRRLTRAVGG